MRIDAHQHFWDLRKFEYPWMPSDPNSPLRRDFMPADLKPKLERNKFDGAVSVQATTQLAETEWLLDLAEQSPDILGVVGWVDLTDGMLGKTLDALQKRPKFRGVRHPVHDEPDEKWFLRSDVLGGLRELERRDIPYDLLVRPNHLPYIPQLVDAVPGLRMVVDHIAKPLIARGILQPWAEDMERVAKIPHIFVKVSGMITEADHQSWKAEHLRPYVAHITKVFGPNRMMFGSDWPVCLLAGTWKEALAAFTQAIGPLPLEVRSRVIGENAVHFYKLKVSTHAAGATGDKPVRG